MRFTLRFFFCMITTLAVRLVLGRADLCGHAPAATIPRSAARARP
jgi:hypothetical protein